MFFGKVRVAQAEGAILAHSMPLPDKVLKKGRCLSAADIRILVSAGVEKVSVARLDDGEVSEHEAAERTALSLCGDNLAVQGSQTGRSNILAARAGLALIDGPQINAINAIDEAVTVATLRPYRRVREGERVASVKVIPFAVKEKTLQRIERLSAASKAIAVTPFGKKRIGLLFTEHSGLKAAVLEKTIKIFNQRLLDLGQDPGPLLCCTHELRHIEAALMQLLTEDCDLLLLCGAIQTADRRDLVPMAIDAIGGDLDYFGMPVEPGNLLLLARYQDIPIIGAPGCARSPKENGFDWVLQRTLADLPVTAKEIQNMGVGGLL